MITEIYIQNYALIDTLNLELKEGFSVITGETGAGKSIMLGALGLVLGNRTDKSVLRDENQKCVVEVHFNDVEHIDEKLSANDIDIEKVLILRREINANGKSRAFVNDTPVKLDILKTISAGLVDIHSQHQNIALLEGKFQLEVLDQVAQASTLVHDYKEDYKIYVSLKNKLDDIIREEAKIQSDKDYYQFLFEEIDQLNYKDKEFETIEENQLLLSNAEEIKTSLDFASHSLRDSEQSLLSQLDAIRMSLTKSSHIPKSISEVIERVHSCHIELEDIYHEISNINDHIEHNPKQLEEINERMHEIQRLVFKHQLQNPEDIISKKEELNQSLNQLQQKQKDKSKIESAIKKATKSLESKAKDIRKKRSSAIPILQKKVDSYLSQLGLPKAHLTVELTKLDTLSADGLEKIQFLFTANPGAAPQALSKSASGGELSRVMLSLKALIHNDQHLASLIFDEIDSGISGKVARQMGELLKVISANRQLICITHLAQIASLGSYHYRASKEEIAKRNTTQIRMINRDERIQELAIMLSGNDDSEAAIQTAKELLAV